MQNENVFNFILLEIVPYKKEQKELARVVAYCSFGFLVNFYTTSENAKKLLEVSREDNYNISNYVKVYYNNNKHDFAYVIKNID